MRNQKLGCVLWIVLFSIITLWGWKLLNFYVLEPRAVMNVMVEMGFEVNSNTNQNAKQTSFQSLWAEWARSSSITFSPQPQFYGDSFVVVWQDTLHVPVFPSIPHEFRLTKAVR